MRNNLYVCNRTAATLCKMQMQFSAKMLCNFLQKGLAKNTPVSNPIDIGVISISFDKGEKGESVIFKVIVKVAILMSVKEFFFSETVNAPEHFFFFHMMSVDDVFGIGEIFPVFGIQKEAA